MVSVIIEEKTPILGIPTDEAFIFINGGTASKQWYLQIRDTSTNKRHRFSLGNHCRGIENKREAVSEQGLLEVIQRGSAWLVLATPAGAAVP
jgi:hypothetical protein